MEITKWDWAYMDFCKRTARLSTAKRAQVGAMIVKDDNILSFGYNGMPSGMSNVCEDENGNTKPEVLHAESNAILKVARSTLSCEGATMYCTFSCCIECAKLIVQAKISRLMFEEVYRNTDGLELLIKAGVEVVQLEPITQGWNRISNVTDLRT